MVFVFADKGGTKIAPLKQRITTFEEVILWQNEDHPATAW